MRLAKTLVPRRSITLPSPSPATKVLIYSVSQISFVIVEESAYQKFVHKVPHCKTSQTETVLRPHLRPRLIIRMNGPVYCYHIKVNLNQARLRYFS